MRYRAEVLKRRMLKIRRRSARALVFAFAFGACGLRASGSPESCASPLEPYHRHVLYFGLSSPLVPGRVITPEMWSAFSRDVLTRHFPAGMTVLDTNGEWRRPDGSHFGEPTKVVIHLARVEDDSVTVVAVQSVIAEAKQRFGYRSVLWERSRACVAF